MQDLTKKSSREFHCVCCDYYTSRSSQYERHLLTAKHQRIQEDCNKNKEKFHCSACDVVMQHLSTYNRHIMTTKHLRMQEYYNNVKIQAMSAKNSSAPEPERPSNNDTEHICECGKKYKFRQGLRKHKKTCSFTPETKSIGEPLENTFTPANMMEFIINIVKTNEDIKQLMVEQMKHHMETEKQQLETQKQQLETQKQLIELVKDPRNNHSNNTTTTNSNNSFNLQFFLNETCKDAINVSEFIENIKIEFSDVENVGKKGYVTGITDMIVRNLSDLGTTKRPIHCTDAKRETIYIKDNDKWDKDSETKEKFQKVLNQIYNKNWNTLRSWAQANPEIRTLDSRENKLYHKILEQTDCIKGQDRLPETNEKIIKKLSETIKVDK